MYVYLRWFLVERILCAVGISTATTEKGRSATIKCIGSQGTGLGIFYGVMIRREKGDGKRSLSIDIPKSLRCCMCSNFKMPVQYVREMDTPNAF